MAWRCEDCGANGIGGVKPPAHRCNDEMYAAYQLRCFEHAFKIFLLSDAGRFETYYAKRVIRQGLLQADVGPGEATANPGELQ